MSGSPGSCDRAPEAPEGRPLRTLALLFTDIEGSTHRWERYPVAMAVALREHDDILRNAIEARGGRVFKTVGDAFYAVFERAEGALAAAIDAQRELGARDWSSVDGLRVRTAIHVGSVVERDGDYFGPTLNRIARIVAIGNGGQVLLSDVAASLARIELPAGVALHDLGEHRLKDLAQPERVFQATASDLQALFPPLRSLSVLPNNLPLQMSSFVGRRAVLERARDLLKSTRVLTLCGAGGIGKTRVALELGGDALARYPQGVYFVDFCAVSQPRDVAGAVASALELPTTVASVDAALREHLKSRRVLLIFDNCEHLIEEIARVGSMLVGSAPEVTILATSREALRIAGEQVYRLPTLDVPAEDVEVDVAAIEASDAVQLFVERARLVDASFSLNETTAPIVADICRRIDGIALAIELAAARISTLSPSQLRARIAGRLVVLTGGNRTALPRQRTVRALIDWSYDLLADSERRMLERFGVFADSFSFEAATAVAAGDDGDDPLDLLARLVDKSLVAVDLDERGEIARYRLLETIREYACEKLAGRGATADAMRAYADWCEALIDRSFVSWGSTPSKTWEALVAHEMAHVRAVLGWLFDDAADPRAASALVARARRFFARIAPVEGARWLATANERLDASAPPRLRADLALAEAQITLGLSQFAEAITAGERAAAQFADLGDELAFAEARGFAGVASTLKGDNERGEQLIRESIATYERHDARALLSYALSDLALSHFFAGDQAGAADLFYRARTAFLALHNERAARITTSNLSEVRFSMGFPAEALDLIDAVIADSPDDRYLCLFLSNRAMYLIALERFAEARDTARASLRAARGGQVEVDMAIALKRVAAVAVLRLDEPPDAERARHAGRAFAVAERRMRELGAAPSPNDAAEAARAGEALVGLLGVDGVAALAVETASWRIDRAVAEASRL